MSYFKTADTEKIESLLAFNLTHRQEETAGIKIFWFFFGTFFLERPDAGKKSQDTGGKHMKYALHQARGELEIVVL